MPCRSTKALGPRDLSFTEFLFEHDGMTAGLRCEGGNDRVCMGHDYDLCSLGCSGDQARKGSEQVRMQTRFRLIQDH